MIPLLASLLGGGGKGLIEQGKELIDEFYTSDEERASANLQQYQAETERLKVEQQGVAGQQAINLEEAKHPSVFVAGWRSGVGWVCLAGFAYNYIVYPFMLWGVAIWAPDVEPPPAIDTGPMMTLLMGLLGIGSLRTYEKMKGVARDRLLPPKKKS